MLKILTKRFIYKFVYVLVTLFLLDGNKFIIPTKTPLRKGTCWETTQTHLYNSNHIISFAPFCVLSSLLI